MGMFHDDLEIRVLNIMRDTDTDRRTRSLRSCFPGITDEHIDMMDRGDYYVAGPPGPIGTQQLIVPASSVIIPAS